MPLAAKQTLLVSFDSYPVPATLQFSAQHKIPFTYFISAPDFITFSQVTNASNLPYYHAQGFSLMETRIPWARNDEVVSNRWVWLAQALALSNEIASHGVGHFDGSHWDEAGWRGELKDFDRYLQFSKARHQPRLTLEIVGFRAPLLAFNGALFRVLPEFHLCYDASFNQPPNLSRVTNGSLILLPLHYLQMANRQAWVLGMDYNFYVFQSKGNPETNGLKLADFQREVCDSYKLHFLRNFSPSNPEPISFGNHIYGFNQWIYWRALTDFMVWAKNFDVEFLTHRAYAARRGFPPPTPTASTVFPKPTPPAFPPIDEETQGFVTPFLQVE